MRQKIHSQSDETFTALAKELALKPMAQHPVGFSTKALDPDEESLISDVSRVPGNPIMSKLDIEKCMRDRLVKNRDEILRAIQSIVFSWPGKVKKKKLFDIINGFWIKLTPPQFESLISDIQEYGDGSIDFRELFVKIEGNRRMKYALSLSDKGKYGVPAPASMTVPGLDLILQSTINSNMKEVTRGLRMYEDKNGLIKTNALKKVLDTFAVSTKPGQFNNLMRLYDPHNTGSVNIHDFLIELGIHVYNYSKRNPDRVTAAAVFNWNEPYFDELANNTRKHALKFRKNDPDLYNLSVNEIVLKFEDKIGKNIDALTKCFLTYDIANSGLIPARDFRNVLSYFVYPTSDNLYREVIQKLPIKWIENMVAWERFLETIKQKVSEIPKQKPSVHRWNKDPHFAIWTKTNGAEICKCGEITNLQNPVTLKGIMEKLRKYNIVPGPVTRKIFNTRTNVGERLITRSDFKLFLGRRCCILSERELKDLLNLLDPDRKNMITYNRFQTLFCENPPMLPVPFPEKDENWQDKKNSWCKSKYDLAETAITNMAPCFPDLTPEDAIVKLRRHMHKNWNNFSKTILARAHDRNGFFIYQEELKLILDMLVMQLTNMQWQHLLKRLGITTGQVNAQYFLDAFSILDVESLDRWNRTVFRLFGDEQKKIVTPREDELEKRILDLLERRGKEFHYDLAKIDSKSYGFVSRKGFRKLMLKHMPDLDDDHFDDLWERLPTNEYSNLDYEWFLRKYKHYYNKAPDHRCQCECNYANKRPEKSIGDENIDYRLLAGGMQADKNPANDGKLKNQPQVQKSGSEPSTSNNSKLLASNHSDASVTVTDDDGLVHVPFRPPTPPKHPHHKDSTVGPLVIHKPEEGGNQDSSNRQSAGMDFKYYPYYTETCEDVYQPMEIARYKKPVESTKSFKSESVYHKVSVPSSSQSKRSVKTVKLSRSIVRCASSQSSREKASCSSKSNSEKSRCPCPRPKTVHSHDLVRENSEDLLKRIVNKYWREIHLELNKLDYDGMGFVKNEYFRTCLRKFGIPMTIEMDSILRKYEVPNSGPVQYLKFLQAFVIHLDREPVTTVVMRRNFQEVPQIPLGSPSAGLYDTLLSLKAPILAHFVDLRRVLRSHDKSGRGWVHAIDFRKLLRHFNLSISDERFFFLMEYFDPNLTGHFHYTEFLRIFTTMR